MLVDGINIQLHPVSVEDAEWIAEVRSKPEIYRFLSQKRGVTLEEQRSWLESESAKEGYYWKIWSKGQSEYLGLISLYDVREDSAELGRFICFESYAAVGAELAVLEFAFSGLKLVRVRCHTAKANAPVVSLHRRLGFKVREEHFEEILEMDMVWQELSCGHYREMDKTRIERLLK